MANADSDTRIEEGKLDLVPMIDTIMLLLLFFLLTTKFTADEQIIASLLPTDKGQGGPPTPVKEPPKEFNIYIVPEGYSRAQTSVKVLDAQWKSEARPKNATVRVGSNMMVMKGGLLQQKPTEDGKKHVEEIHGFVASALASVEQTGTRESQVPIVINCFSGLEWKYALMVYDACRNYEGEKGGFKKGSKVDVEAIRAARSVSFAPPAIRNYRQWEMGQELQNLLLGK